MHRPIRRSVWIVFLLIASLTISTFVHVHVLLSSDGTTSGTDHHTIWKPGTLVNALLDTDDVMVTDSYPFQERTTVGVADSDNHEMAVDKPLVLIWNAPNTPFPPIPTADTCGGGCEISHDRRRIQESSAVVFHMKGVPADDIPDQNSRDGNQLYVWWSEDSPWMSKHMYNSSEQFRAYDNNFFNWTMTYKPSSDVNAMMIPYNAIDFVMQRMTRNWTNDAVYGSNGDEPFRHSKSQEEIDQLKMQAQNLIDKKSKMAIWIASNCGYTAAAVLRRKIVTDLQFQGLKVDVFGRCGDTDIPDDLSGFLNLISQYKFILAFENALHCKSYISEKFWYNGLYAGTIPIVWGPIKSDLEALAPENSYIYYDDFTSPESLVQHLHHLSKNKTKYMEYLSWWWKSPGTFPVFGVTEFRKDLKGRKASYDFELNAFCNLCYLLSRKVHLKRKKTIQSIEELWYAGESTTCLDKFHSLEVDRYGISHAGSYQVFKYHQYK